MDESGGDDYSTTKELCKFVKVVGNCKSWNSTSNDWEQRHEQRRYSDDEDGTHSQPNTAAESFGSGWSTVWLFVCHDLRF